MPRRPHNLVDRLGATGALVCAVHCALLPAAIALLPSLGIAARLGDGFERGFVACATLLGLFTLFRAYRRYRTVQALWLLLPGLAALWAGVMDPQLHHAQALHAITMTLGGTLVGMAHLSSLRLDREYHAAGAVGRARANSRDSSRTHNPARAARGPMPGGSSRRC